MKLTTTIAIALTAALAAGACKKKEAAKGAPPPTTGSATGSAATPPPAVTPLEGEALARHYIAAWDAWNGNDKVKFRAAYADDAISRWPDNPMTPERRGGDAIVEEAWNFRAAFPDAKSSAKLVFVNGRTVAAVWLTTGTNTAAMKGPGGEMPPTGKPIGLLMFHQVTMDDRNRIADEWYLVDGNALMSQLGMSPAPARPVMADDGAAPMIAVSTGNDAEKANLNVAQKGNEDFNKRDADALAASWADDGVESDQAAPADVAGKAAIAEGTKMFLGAFSDGKISPLSLFAAGDYVVSISAFTGTNDGDMGPMPKTGKPVKITVAEVTRLDNGKLKQLWRFWDSSAMAMQMGLMPAPGADAPAAPPAKTN